jgi:hypothetical protein
VALPRLRNSRLRVRRSGQNSEPLISKKQGETTMKKLVLTVAAILAFSVPAFAAEHSGHDHSGHDMDHGSMQMEHGGGMMAMGKLAHEEVVDGVKATFNVIDIQKKMKEMGMKETHHIMVVFTDVKSGKKLGEGEVKLKVQAPDKSEQTKDLMGMESGFGADFEMPKKGKYGVMCKFQLKDGKVRQAKFWYTVK